MIINAPAVVWCQSGMHRPEDLEWLQAIVEVKMEVLQSLIGLIKDAIKP